MQFASGWSGESADFLTVLQDELEVAMRLCGVTDLAKARGDLSYLNTSELELSLPKPQARSWFSGFRARL